MIIQGRLIVQAYEPPRPGWVRVEQHRIAELGAGDPPEPAAAGDPEALVCPGFYDAHLHLPQLNAVGCDGMELMTWLDEIVFPAEMRWQDADVACADVIEAYRRMVRAGTLGYAGFLTVHQHGIDAARSAGRQLPLRAIAGAVLMDRNAPQPLLSTATAGVGPSPSGRLSLSVNPRFAPSCTDELLALAADRAAEDVFIQTHLAESRQECDIVGELFPDDPHYAGVYDRHGLLTNRSLLAHCLHLGEDEWRLIAERRSVVVHCPTANTFLRSGLFDLDAAREHGVRLALGSDIAAGPDVAMPRVARAMIETAKVRALAAADAHVPSPAEVWALITRGNAEALGFADGGRLEAGAAADLLVLKTPLPVDEHLIGRLIYTWRDDYIDRCVINGELVDPKAA